MSTTMANASPISKNFVVRLLVKHWTVIPIVKTPEQEKRERRLFLVLGGVPFNRWMLFIASFLIQFCCGSLYSWSNFNAPIDILIYGSKTADKAPNTFYIAVGMFGTTAMILGPWLERQGPRKAVLLGSTSFGLGNAITAISLSRKSIVGVYIGYGVLGGFGLGLNYISPVSALQKYFPDFRGVASGFAVAGFGAGSTVWSKVYLPLIDRYKLPWTFGILAFVQTGAMLIAAIVLRTPPNDYTVRGVTVRGDKLVDSRQRNDSKVQAVKSRDVEANVESAKNSHPDNKVDVVAGPNIEINLIQSMFSTDFWFMYLTLFANGLFGLVVLSRLSSMVQDLFGQTRTEGANVVSINGVFNCLGRLFLPALGDLAIKALRVNPPFIRKLTFVFTLVTQVCIVSTLRHIINSRNYAGFRGVIWTLTFAYGGGFGTIPCFLTDMFGPYNIGALHGLILTAWSIGGIGGGLGFTDLFNRHKPSALPAGQTYPLGAFDKAYESNFTWILAVLSVGICMVFFVRTDPQDRTSPGWRFSIFGKKVVHLGPNYSKADQDRYQYSRADPQQPLQ